MASVNYQFEIPSKMKTWSLGLIVIGLLSIIVGFATKSNPVDFWGTLMYNSIFFLLVANAAMFFLCLLTIAWGGWQTSFRRVMEAISTVVPIFGLIALVLLAGIVMNHGTGIYKWADPTIVAHDKVIQGKAGFLNPTFYLIWTVLSIGLWILLGHKMRKLSDVADKKHMDFITAKRYMYRNTAVAALFIAWFALTVGSFTPWMWMMSTDAHWYSTMYSWYIFATTFVTAVSVVTLFVIYLKNKGYLEYTNQEHIHDLGKFMFAFSIFWTYIWFDQYMLLWYSNIPEETLYFQSRIHGPYRGIFFLNLIINFVCPILILMKRSAKRNYTLVAFMAILIIFGHWMDFYQIIMGTLAEDHLTFGWLDFGVAAFFVGMLIFFTGKALTKKPLVPKYHPFLKESIVHHT